MEVTLVITALALIAFFFLLSKHEDLAVSLAFVIAFCAAMFGLGVMLQAGGLDIVGARNQTQIYAYNDFNFTTNQSTIANVTIIQSAPSLVNTRNFFTDIVGWALILLGITTPIAAILYTKAKWDGLAEQRRNRDLQGEE